VAGSGEGGDDIDLKSQTKRFPGKELRAYRERNHDMIPERLKVRIDSTDPVSIDSMSRGGLSVTTADR
jgi:hypothetical protein